ncbi:MAG: cell division protein FtsQ/DivIB [Planctomycetota bacterium]|jgi:hypothetical protein
MARRKKTKPRTKRVSFKARAPRRRKTRKRIYRPSSTNILKIISTVTAIAAAILLFYFAERYLKSVKSIETGPLELMNVPEWVSEQLKEKIYAAAGGNVFRLDDTVARQVANNLAYIVWLSNVTVRTAHNSVRVYPEFRKPIALVKSGLRAFYVDAELVALDFVPIPKLPIVEVRGMSVVRTVPPPGEVLQQDDLAAAVAILARLDEMDKRVTPDKPLLYEIDRIDVSNFNGRESKRAPHIVLYAKGNIEIIWGAELGTWQRYFEATDLDKLAKLYTYYKEHGSLLNGAPYINLRDPQDSIPLPIDKY